MRLSSNLLASLCILALTQGAAMAQSSISQTSTGSAGGAASSLSTSTDNSTAMTAPAKNIKKKKLRKSGDDYEGSRALNMFQLEPSVINERYYTSGAAEHSQKISPTLPPGAPIPDNEGPYAPEKPQTTGLNQPLSDKLDDQVKVSLRALQGVKNESPTLKLKLRVSTMDDALLSHLKEMKVDVISTSRASGDLVVYAPAQKVNELGGLSQVQNVLLAQ